MRYRNLSVSLGKLTCLSMIKVAFRFAGLDVAAHANVQRQLNVLRFEKPTGATDL